MVNERSTRFLVIRHAESGCKTSTILSRRGSLQALAIAQTLRGKDVTAIYSSKRSQATAITISQETGKPFEVDDRLSPCDWGLLSGLSREEAQKQAPDIYQKRFVERIPDYKMPKGESLNDRLSRVKSFVQEKLEMHRGGVIVVITHGGVIDDIYRLTCSLPVQKKTGLRKPYGSISVLEHDSTTGRWSTRDWVGVNHLPQVVAVAPTGGQLYLFPHQVAGSFPFLRGDMGELCKPAMQRELEVYERLKEKQPPIADFAPMYLGKLSINVMELIQNLKTLRRPFQRMMDIPQDDVKDNKEEEITQDEGLEMSKCDIDTEEEPIEMKRRRHSLRDELENAKNASGAINTEKHSEEKSLIPEGKSPWSVNTLWDQFQAKRCKKVIQESTGEFVYLILENLTHGLNCPHILDLKVGTQQHGPHDTDAKKQSKEKRCRQTTSATLGIRVGGMQTYDEKLKQYVLHDKYWGRSLNDKTFEGALRTFLSDSEGAIRTQVTKKLILQVNGLMEAVKGCNWRFYGCSVLLVYDAKPRKQRAASFNALKLQASNETGYRSDGHDDVVEVCAALSKKRRARSQSFGAADDEHQISVRIIDFAKTEMDGYSSFDPGFMFGLTSLKDLLTEILNDALEPDCKQDELKVKACANRDEPSMSEQAKVGLKKSRSVNLNERSHQSERSQASSNSDSFMQLQNVEVQVP